MSKEVVMNEKIDDTLLNFFDNHKPVVFVEAFSDPRSDTGKYLKYNQIIPADAFRIRMSQRFPIITSRGWIDSTTSSYNIYLGKRFDVGTLYEFRKFLNDEIRGKVESFNEQGVKYAVSPFVSEEYGDTKDLLFPLHKEDACLSTWTELSDVVETITALHEDLIRLPINEQSKVYRKFLNGNGD